MAVPDRLLEDGEHADFPGWRMRAVHTPGHTPGHLCFAEERTGCSSPATTCSRGSARTSPPPTTGTPDPLGDYLQSLAAASADREPAEVLPAHEWRFRGLADRAGQLREHHEHRLTELLDAIRDAPALARPWQLAAHLTWSRPWDQYERRMRIFAVTETDAHLRLLATPRADHQQRRCGADVDARPSADRPPDLAARIRAGDARGWAARGWSASTARRARARRRSPAGWPTRSGPTSPSSTSRTSTPAGR